MKFKTLIVDDEPLARQLISSHVSKVEGLEVAGEFGDAIQVSNYLRTHQVDLIFLDIQMPEINGLQFIQTLKNPPAIIFITAYRDFAPEAFELDAIDYLLKPVSFERLLKAVNKFFERKSLGGAQAVDDRGESFIYIKADRKMHKVSTTDIVYVESLDEYVKVHLSGAVLVSRENITTLEEKLSGGGFVRVHRSFLVSAKYVTAVSTEGVVVNGKQQVPFGRAFKLSALAALGIHPK